MLLYQRLEFILLHLDFVDSHFDELSPISRRMYATGIAFELNQLVSQLTIIDEQIESTLSFEDAYLDVESLSSKNTDYKKLREEYLYREDNNNDAEINKLIDIFPLNKENYSFSSENAEKLKTGLRYLSSDGNISSRDYVYAIQNGLRNVFSLLASISHKKSYIKDYQYEDFWYAVLYRDDDYFSARVIYDYNRWKEEHDYQDMQVLKDKCTQEILTLLESGVFNYDIKPVRREIINCNIDLPEEAFEQDIEIPEEIKIELARFSKYVSYKEDILCLDYLKLGKYIYKHFRELRDEHVDSLIYFDYMLLHIHEDMAECNPKLKKHLRFYEDDKLEEILRDAQKSIESCNSLIKEGVQQDFLSVCLSNAFYGDNKIEVQRKLQGQSKYTILCQILGMMKSTQKVFRLEVTSADLAKALSTVVTKPKEASLKRYIDEGASDNQSRLAKWMNQYIIDKLGSKGERLFLDIAKK